MNTIHSYPRSAQRIRQQGLSLVEIMVAVTISLLLLAGVISLMVNSRETYTMQDGMGRLQENARYILERISQDTSRSGYLGCSDSSDVPILNNLTDQSPSYDFSAAIFGQDDAGLNNTDILTLRYGSSGGIRIMAPINDTEPGEDIIHLDTTNANYDQLEQFDILTVSDCDNVSIMMITNNPATSGGAIQHITGVTATSGPNAGQSNSSSQAGGPFFAQNASVATAFRTTSTTYLVGVSSNGNGLSLYANNTTPENELIQGVEDFQVLYGMNDDAVIGADRYVTANNVTNGGTDWNDVVSVRITLTLNTVDRSVQGGGTISKTFSKTIRLRNRGDIIS